MNLALAARVLREKRAVILPLGIALLGNLAIGALVVYPLHARVRAAEGQEGVSTQSLAAAGREFVAAQATLTGMSLAEKDLKRFYAEVLPVDLAGARRATYVLLAQLARDADLQYQRRSEQTRELKRGEASTTSDLTRFEIAMVLKGEYESIRQFLRDIEASKAFIVIDNVGLAEGTEPGSPLVLTVELSTYYRGGG